MLSKSPTPASVVLATVLFAGCNSLQPWQNEPQIHEVNLSFTLENNLLRLPAASIDGVRGRYFFASAAQHSVLSPRIASEATSVYTFTAGDQETMTFAPIIADLGASVDGLIGADIVGRQSVTIDYRSGLVTLQTGGVQPAFMSLSHFTGEPATDITIDGKPATAIIDTALPDTIVLPAATPGRGRATVVIAGTGFKDIDVRYARVEQPRLGNRVLSKFVIGIDYGRGIAGLWRDPRIR